MNCQSPSAPALDFTCGLKPLSMTERYFNSIGMSCLANFSSYISKYNFDRPRTILVKDLLFLAKNLITLTTSSLQDRKSTRLNSSHVRISYAVFCLKKKKQITTMREVWCYIGSRN